MFWLRAIIFCFSQQHRELNITLDEANRLFEGFRQYQTDEKPEKIEEKSRLETTFRTLQTRLRLNKRPVYLPADGMLIADIIILWRELESSERKYEASCFLGQENLY